MYAYLYVAYIYIYIYIHTHTHTHIYIHTYLYIYIYITVPPFAARISRVVADVQAPGGKSGNIQRRGKAMANYPQELARDAVCQSHTSHMTVLVQVVASATV